jgi:hypothetical protein
VETADTERNQTAAESVTGTPRQRGKPFGSPGHDARELGRRGGEAPRTRKYTAQLREQVVSGSGIASFAAYRTWLADLEGRERAVRVHERRFRDADMAVCNLLDQVDEETARRDALRAEVAELRDQRAELERQCGELRAAIAREAEAAEMELVELSDVGGEDDTGLAQTA